MSKTHQDYWKPRLKRRSYRDRDGKLVEIPEWQVRMFHLTREAWFQLDTANQAAAAVKARDIYLDLVSTGWDATLAKHKPSPTAKDKVCTVGEFLADVQARSHLKPITIRRYARKLRKIVTDVAKLEAGLKGRAKRAKFDNFNGGHAAWLAKVDGQRLDVLTPEALNVWRNGHVSNAGTDPLARKSAERTAASKLRNARALFAPDVLAALTVRLPPNPFVGVKLKDPGPQRYRSDVSAEWLLLCAERELRATHPQQYLGLFLCLWGGLRRKEADLLTWPQIDFKAGQINIRRTAYFEPKTEESQRQIDLVPAAIDVLRQFKPGVKMKAEFVLAGGEPNLAVTYDYYRCDRMWRELNAWLRGKGVNQTKAVHSLRKESGSLIASDFGIEAARQHLGHRTIKTTSEHYADKKKRIEVRLPLGGAGKLQSVA